MASKSTPFYGVIFCEKGISPDPEKVQSLKNAQAPSNQQELRSFIGMYTYFSRFIVNYSSKTAPLRLLLKNNAKFTWGEAQQNSFDELKNDLTNKTTVAYFNPEKECKLWIDASNYAIGAILLQENNNGQEHPISYISRSLTETEQKYCITEKEALALVWAVEKFHIYLYGDKFTIFVDHQPLKQIFGPKNRGSPRIERWQLKMQCYRYQIVYKKGSSNISDFMSRLHTQSEITANKSKYITNYIHFVAEHAIPHSMTLEQVKIETSRDKETLSLLTAIRTGKFTNNTKKYEKYKHEFSEYDGIALRCNRIVLPLNLQKRALDIVHESHSGIAKTKSFLRSNVYWYGMDRDVENCIKDCLSCQAVSRPYGPPPVNMSKLPDNAWTDLSIDFYGPLTNGKKLLVIIDNFSRFPFVKVMKSTTANIVINRLEELFITFGYPSSIRSDNGPTTDPHLKAKS